MLQHHSTLLYSVSVLSPVYTVLYIFLVRNPDLATLYCTVLTIAEVVVGRGEGGVTN